MINTTANQPQVRCRLNASTWVAVAVLGVIFGLPGLTLLVGAVIGAADWAIAGLLAILLLTPTLPLFFWAMRATIIADADGLRWRGLGRWRQAAWSEVSDYYAWIPQSSSSRSSQAVGPPPMCFTIKTSAGNVQVGPSWSNVDAFKACVQQNATQARTMAWGILHERPEDLPHVFHYDTAINRNTLPVLRQWHGYTLAAVVVYFAYQWATKHTLPGWGWLLTPTGLFVLAKSAALLALQPTYAETRRRLGQRITVQADRLIWEDGDRRIDAPWEDVAKYFQSGMRYVVVTKQGSFDFLGTLRELELLQKLVCRYAVNAPKGVPSASRFGWPYGGAMPSDLATRPAKQKGENGRVYSYDTGSISGLLGGALTMLLFAGLAAGAPLACDLTSGIRPSPAVMLCAALGVSSLLLAVWLCTRCIKSSVRIDDAGITQATPFGKRFIPWEQVQDFYQTGSYDLTFGNIIGRNSRIRFWNAIADVDELKDEIARRAANSRRREWGKKQGAFAVSRAGE